MSRCSFRGTIDRRTTRPASPTEIDGGEIAIVNSEQHFVLIDLGPNFYVPPPGTKLRALREGATVAHLKASAEQKPPFIAADIIDGEAAVGDQVRQEEQTR